MDIFASSGVVIGIADIAADLDMNPGEANWVVVRLRPLVFPRTRWLTSSADFLLIFAERLRELFVSTVS